MYLLGLTWLFAACARDADDGAWWTWVDRGQPCEDDGGCVWVAACPICAVLNRDNATAAIPLVPDDACEYVDFDCPATEVACRFESCHAVSDTDSR
jgi:hypothetical protein